jgi:Ca2+-binding RTX toxin-like protein
VPFLFIPRTTGFQILDIAGPYSCTPDNNPANDTPALPAPPVDAEEVRVRPEFDSWGYAHQYENAAGKMRRVDSHAIDEALSRNYANDFGDLSIHEFATDPTEYLAYSSYYSGGMRVFSFGPGGLVEQGRFIDDEGSNFWGVEQFTGADGERYFAGSDRDYGLQIFRYTGPGAAQRPVCTDSVSMVPYKSTGPVSLPCTDANGNPLTRAVSTQPTAGTLTGVGSAATATYTHTGNRLGNVDQFQFTANDGAATSAPATARIVVVPRNGGRCFNPFVGTAARETLTGSRFGDRLRGGGGNDTLEGRGGADCLSGDGGRDTVRGNDGNDRVNGGRGRDRLFGNDGRDTVRGGPGDDSMMGGDGRDRMFGLGGDDRIEADSGRGHLLSGGGGSDRLFAANGKRDTIRCGGGQDTVRADRDDRVSRDCESVRTTRGRR